MTERHPITFKDSNQNEGARALIRPEDYRMSGEIETSFDLKKLPPTKISEQALEALKGWNLTTEKIDAFRYFLSSFRYDLVPKKVERLKKESIKVYRSELKEYVVIPSFFDKVGRLDGQCLDINRQVVRKFYESGLFDLLNQGLDKDHRIVPSMHSGLSKTHFCVEGNHCWNGLVLVDENDSFVLDRVYADASFQTIETKGDKNFTEHKSEENDETEEIIDPEDIIFEGEYKVPIGTIKVDDDSFTFLGDRKIPILGRSSCTNYVYGLRFARDVRTGKIMTAAKVFFADGINSNYYIIGNNGQILVSHSVSSETSFEKMEVSDEGMKEVKDILNSTSSFNFIEVNGDPPEEIGLVWERPKHEKEI